MRFPEERVKAVDKAIKFWIQQLVDPSRRNNLLFYRDTLTTTLPLDAADVPSVNRLLEGRPVLLDEFVNSALKEEEQEEQLKDLRKRATVIYRIAQRNDEEAGLETLYLAIGFATWDIGGGTTDRPPASPVLLMPIGMRPRGQGSLRSFTLEPLGEVVVNPVLLHALAALGVQVDEATLLSGIEGLEDRDPGMRSPDDAHQVFERLTAAAHGLRGVKVEARHVLSNFQYYKMAMVADLKRHRDALIAHPIIATIAGDGASRREAATGGRATDLLSLALGSSTMSWIAAKVRDEQNLILDADSSHCTRVSGPAGASSRPQPGHTGPVHPGTGKSHAVCWIANLMA